jgi:hypothetical protein
VLLASGQVREERVRVNERLDRADSSIDDGYEVLEMTLKLLGNPLALYQAAKLRHSETHHQGDLHQALR